MQPLARRPREGQGSREHRQREQRLSSPSRDRPRPRTTRRYDAATSVPPREDDRVHEETVSGRCRQCAAQGDRTTVEPTATADRLRPVVNVMTTADAATAVATVTPHHPLMHTVPSRRVGTGGRSAHTDDGCEAGEHRPSVSGIEGRSGTRARRRRPAPGRGEGRAGVLAQPTVRRPAQVRPTAVVNATPKARASGQILGAVRSSRVRVGRAEHRNRGQPASINTGISGPMAATEPAAAQTDQCAARTSGSIAQTTAACCAHRETIGTTTSEFETRPCARGGSFTSSRIEVTPRPNRQSPSCSLRRQGPSLLPERDRWVSLPRAGSTATTTAAAIARGDDGTTGTTGAEPWRPRDKATRLRRAPGNDAPGRPMMPPRTRSYPGNDGTDLTA